MKLLPTPFSFFFNDTATTEIYTLSLHDALPISLIFIVLKNFDANAEDGRLVFRTVAPTPRPRVFCMELAGGRGVGATVRDRKSTRLNSSHDQISYAVFCLKKKYHH